ncbi:MAG: hypothetical protein PHS65_01625 [Arcobacteraceae bacterium]|nr:hypothetical protein [Arcobacteraceae bacterium]
MIIEISGGQSGIREYLENGEKEGRGFTRDEADKRVTLSGDLDVTDSIIKSLDFKENYHHITLSFKEDFVSQEDLQKAVNEFEQLVRAAYKDEELNFYAEAHIPKIKSYKAKNGEIVIRKPHIHIVIPNVNMITGKYMEPFGRVDNNTHYIDSFQELFNQDNGFASPKDNRQNGLNHEAEIIARQTGTLFTMNKVEKEEILNFIIENKINSYSKFEEYLNTQGEVKTRNKGKGNEYLNIQFAHKSKGVNLKEFCFSKEFIEEYSYKDKLDFLQKETENVFVEKKEVYESKKRAKYEELLKDWFDFRAREIKYINYKSKFYKEIYKNASKLEKIELLNQKEQEFYAKYNIKNEIKEEIKGIAQGDIKDLKMNSPKAKREFSQSVAGSKLSKIYAQKKLETTNFKGFLIKDTYDKLTNLKGVLSQKYGYDEKRNVIYLNNDSKRVIGIKEFLVEHMNLLSEEIQMLENSILRIEQDYTKYGLKTESKGQKMAIKVNIKANEQDKNKVDYLQLGEVDRIGKFTGFIYDQAGKNSSATLFVIADKVVDYEEFKKLPNFKELDEKMNMIVNTTKETHYSKELKMNYVKENLTLTTPGQSYANSKHNFQEMRPIEIGISQFKNAKSLDKNIFTVAKEFVQENWYKAKDKVQFLLTSKRDLAVSNIVLTLELQQMKAKLEDIKTYQQALEKQTELIKGYEQKEAAASQEQSKPKKEYTFGELFEKLDRAGNLRDNLNFGKELLEDKNFIEQKEAALSVLDSIKNGDIKIDKEEIKTMPLNEIKAMNTMTENNIVVNSSNAVKEFVNVLKSVQSMSLEQGLDMDQMLKTTLERLSDKFPTKNQEHAKSQAKEVEAEM